MNIGGIVRIRVMYVDKPFKRVGTHSGKFHADEVMATAILMELFDLEVVRSRDPEELMGLDLIYDIGEGEFDHHQMDKRYRDSGTPYAACGLIWESFGRDVIRMYDGSLSDENVDYIFHETDAMLIEGIDAADNGLRTCRTIIPTFSITAVISKLNPAWDDETDENGDVKPLPLSWAGKRDGDLCAVTGVEDAVFCHSDRFIAGAGSLNGIMKLAELALAEPDEPEPEKADTGTLSALKRFFLSRRIRVVR